MQGVIPEYGQNQDGQIEKITVQVLQYERKCSFSRIGMTTPHLDSACRRGEEISAVISLTVVVAGGSKAGRHPQNQNGWRERPTRQCDFW